ncbi:MAG: PhaM family polyhydroxyalkanoate granule multifunctional regulatory protein, partial [Vitreoscilla sp.]
MSDIPNFAKLVPGFDFLQGLVKNAGSALPNIGQWVAPTLNPEELQKRIDELKTVQFWLEQNGKMLGTTIQALEVQKMTLSTLKTMNVQMTDLRDAMKVAPMASAGSAASAAAGSVANSFGADALMQAARNAMGNIPGMARPAAPEPAPTPEPEPAPAPAPRSRSKAAAAEPPAVTAAGVVDPMQWWGALTKQFTQLAASAMKDSATDAAKSLAGAMMKQGMDAAGETIKKAVAMPAGVAAKAMSA